ncbi:hypothetical protein [Turicimonas muris]|uniref:hypothetical protein n=1 Tax=Turicimonas muris TaxID=1796652 RepID=UPI002494C994|nr:hypothetical protein [Turicimonas muris]
MTTNSLKTFTNEELKVLALMSALISSGKVKINLPSPFRLCNELPDNETKHLEDKALLHRELESAVQILTEYMVSFDINQG